MKTIKPTYVLYVLGLIFTLLFAANCDCNQKDPAPEQHTATTIPCTVTTFFPGSPAVDITLPNGSKIHLPATPSYIQNTPCPDTTNSPIWGKAQQPVYSPAPTTRDKSLSIRALGPGLAAYLPQVLLALPFSPRPSATDKIGRAHV